jgi:phosphoesterase RecJ-like protein
MTTTEIAELKELLSTPKNVVIVPHKNPDGDAMGSTLALWHYLIQNKHKAVVIAPNDYPLFLKWLPGESEVLNFETHNTQAISLISEADIIFTLDFNALHRTDTMEPILNQANGIKVMIDHHQQPDNYATYMYSDVNMCSTSEMVYHFIEQLGDLETITPEIGTAIYTGIMTDTASFRFPLTTSTTHRVVAHLMDIGINHFQIHNQIYDNNSYEKLQLLGCALSNLKLNTNLKTAYISLSSTELDKHDFKKGDTEGIVNYGLSIKGVKLAAIFIEHKIDGIIKISFRSKGEFDVNQFARTHFNGGGHKNAAGGRSESSLKNTISKFEALLIKYKTELRS